MDLRGGGFCYIEPENSGELCLEEPEMRAWITFCVFLLTTIAVTGKGYAIHQRASANLLFINHSCVWHLLADADARVGGEKESAEQCIYVSPPNGSGLCTAMEAAGFQVNEASYDSLVSEDTDLCHWNRKFRDQMFRALQSARQDELLPLGQANSIVAFKSCYPNLQFESACRESGDPDSCERTLANSKAAYCALLPSLVAHSEVLFVAPPPSLSITRPSLVGIKAKPKAFFQRGSRWADFGRQFVTWISDRQHGWLAGYQGRNIVVFDYYDVLTGGGGSDWSAHPEQAGSDSHPNVAGNQRVATTFVPFLDNAWKSHRVTRG
jgi:hypothetical protein